MTSILDQLNFIRYSKDEFIKEKEKVHLVLSSELESIIKIIEANIKKSGGSNSPFQNSHNGGSHKNKNYSLKSTSYNSKHSDSSKRGSSKSWRITKTKIIADNLSSLEKNKNEINALLNKLSPKNFDKIVPRIQEYYNKDDERDSLLESTIDNIFLKAVMQPVYCPYYVKLLKIMNESYKKEGIINNKCIEFKTILKSDVKESEPDTENKEIMTLSEKEKYDLFCKANKEKKYKEGYSQFIGELFNNGMINVLTLEENVSLFVESLENSTKEDAKSTYVEDALICIYKLFDTVSNIEKNIIRTYCERVILIKDNSELPKRLKFKLMDLRDLLVKRKVIFV